MFEKLIFIYNSLIGRSAFPLYALRYIRRNLIRINAGVRRTHRCARPARRTAELTALTAVWMLVNSCDRSPVADGTFRCSANTNRVRVMQLESNAGGSYCWDVITSAADCCDRDNCICARKKKNGKTVRHGKENGVRFPLREIWPGGGGSSSPRNLSGPPPPSTALPPKNVTERKTS